jgi:hypothetical protein
MTAWVMFAKREDIITLNFTAAGCESVNWIELAQGTNQWWAVVKTVMNILAS